MLIPKAPVARRLQRYDTRFWNTDDMLAVAAVYYGVDKRSCPYTWRYRALISAHRARNSTHPYKKPYGKDWKHEIKKDFLYYMESGKLPLAMLEFGAGHIRAAELAHWGERYQTQLMSQEPHLAIAAE